MKLDPGLIFSYIIISSAGNHQLMYICGITPTFRYKVRDGIITNLNEESFFYQIFYYLYSSARFENFSCFYFSCGVWSFCVVLLFFLGVFVVYGNIVQKSVNNEENIVLLCKASVENPITDL